jgi:hypothetical protein
MNQKVRFYRICDSLFPGVFRVYLKSKIYEEYVWKRQNHAKPIPKALECTVGSDNKYCTKKRRLISRRCSNLSIS